LLLYSIHMLSFFLTANPYTMSLCRSQTHMAFDGSQLPLGLAMVPFY